VVLRSFRFWRKGKERHTPGAEAPPMLLRRERAKAEALAYLEAKDAAGEEGAERERRRQNVPQWLKPHRECSARLKPCP
jgi:hypothetical protein